MAADDFISADTVRVYRLRIVRPTEPDGHLAAVAGLSEQRVARAQTELRALGLLRESFYGGWVAVAPDSAADRLLARAEAELARHNVTLATVRAGLQALSSDYLEARALRAARSGVEHLDGTDDLRALTEELTRTATRSVQIAAPLGRRAEAAAAAALPLDLRMLRRGLTVRCLWPEAARALPALLPQATALHRAGARLRTLGCVPARLCVYDEASALLCVDPDDPAAGVMVVRDRTVLRFLVGLFDHLWEQAADFTPGAGTAPAAPTGTELAVLRGIAAGRTNDAVARELGISPRTVTRHIADLMRRLGTASRFQAGVRAVQLGWLEDGHG